MRPFITRLVSIVLLTAFCQAANAQTYTVTANGESWATLTGANSNNCNDCTIIIPAGWTLDLNTAGTCDSCSFNGGTVNISHSFTFQNNATVFNNDTVLVGVSTTFYNVDFSSDSVAINAPLTSQNGTTTIANSRVYVNTSSAVSINEATFTNDSLHLNSSLTIKNPTANFTSSNVDVASGVTLSLQQTTFTNSVFAFAGSSSMSVNNSLTATGSSFYLGGTSTVSSSGSTTIQTGSNVVLYGTTNSFSANNLNTVTNSNIILNSSTSSSFTASSLTMTGTGSLIGEGTGATINISNAINLTSTAVTLSGAVLSGSSLTTSGGSLGATGSTISDGNALSMTNTPTSLNSTSLSASSITTSGGSFSATGSAISDGNALSSTNTADTLDNTTINPSSISTTGGSFVVSGASTISTGNAVAFSGTAVSIGGSSKLTAASGTLTANGGTDGTLTMSGSATMTFGNSFNLTSSNAYMDGTSSLTANSMSLSSSSFLQIGDGPLADSAFVKITNTFSTDNTSTASIKNNKNYLYTTNNIYKNSNVSCGGGGNEKACQTDYVYGCATISNTSAVGCTVLALANISLTAVPAGSNAVNLSWSDGQSATASHYLVQRSSDNGDWTTLATVEAGGYTAGDYQFEDPAAPAGTDNYRIARIDQDGAVLYSAISSVSIAAAATATGAFSIYPNPATGHTFFIRVPNTEPLAISVFTVTGQLLFRQSFEGQTQYQVLLPSRLLPGNAVIVQAITTSGKQAFPLLLQ